MSRSFTPFDAAANGALPIRRRLLPSEQPLKEFLIRTEVCPPQAVYRNSEIDDPIIERIRQNAESTEYIQIAPKRFLAAVPVVNQQRVSPQFLGQRNGFQLSRPEGNRRTRDRPRALDF